MRSSISFVLFSPDLEPHDVNIRCLPAHHQLYHSCSPPPPCCPPPHQSPPPLQSPPSGSCCLPPPPRRSARAHGRPSHASPLLLLLLAEHISPPEPWKGLSFFLGYAHFAPDMVSLGADRQAHKSYYHSQDHPFDSLVRGTWGEKSRLRAVQIECKRLPSAHRVINSSQMSSGSMACPSLVVTKSTTSWLLSTSQMP